MSISWKRVGRSSGYLVKCVTVPAEKSPPSFAARLKEREREEARRRPIEFIDTRSIKRLCPQLGGDIADIIERRESVELIEGVLVASLRLMLHVSFELDGAEQVSDGIRVTIYRNPKRPTQLLSHY